MGLLREQYAEWKKVRLLQSSVDEKMVGRFIEYYIYLRNIQDLLSDGKTPYERVPF